MPRDINARLADLRARRRGTDKVSRSRVAASSAGELLQKSAALESWEKRASSQASTRYVLGAMEAVDPAYTQKSRDEADRVAKQLNNGLGIEITTRLQGSVPLDVHIRGVSDVDLLLIRTDFLTYRNAGARSKAGHYTAPSSRTSLEVLAELRKSAEDLLTTRYWGATVDCSGGKAISLSGGSLERPVDVVPAHWDDTMEYQDSLNEHDRGVTILNKLRSRTIDGLPFTHIKRVSDRDLGYLGGLKKVIRLVKNVKNDAESATRAAGLPSFDIAALLYHADKNALTAGYRNELYILAEAQRFLDWCYANKSQAQTLKTPDGSRPVLDSEAKFDAILAISSEMDDLARQVAREQGFVGTPLSAPSDMRRILGEARIPPAL